MWKGIRPDWFSRLCRPMCGRSLTFRKAHQLVFGAMPQQGAAPREFDVPFRWGRAATAHQVAEPRKPVPYGKHLLVAFILALLTACQAASSRQPAPSEPVSAGVLTKEYQESTTDARRKYDGKEITVKGLTVMTPMMPPSPSDQGLVFLEEKEANPPRRVSCWFSNDQAEQFSTIKGGQYITVKGIFNGEAGAELKFCKLVKIE
jgi:tRNA_anti-like